MQRSRALVLTDSIFGYSMLYPYTDDLVDCNDMSQDAKREFARVFHERLLIGEPNYDPELHFNGQQSNVVELRLPPSLQPYADRIGKIFDMVRFIENDWKRGEYKCVYMSLATIHESQIKSTLQHARPDDGDVPTMQLVEQVSAEKGGASLIAAGFLIEGRLTRATMAYLEYFGFGLQLLDDLQCKSNFRDSVALSEFEMSRELPIDKDKKVEGPRLGSSTERDASSLECDKSVVSVKPKLPSAPSVASVSSRRRSVRSTTSKAASRASLVSNDILESMNKLMIAAMSMMKDAQKIQADALLRSFNQQQNASQTQLTPVKTMTSVSTDVPITVVANLRASVVSLPPNLFNSSNFDISQHAKSLPLDGKDKGEKSKLLDECTSCHRSKIYPLSIVKSDSST
ncbi:unnamed protein product [Didymodactylos carnosus]|uniref:Uncharacterized protein n=1 Tax=Didymodactylos carnosus TaxID=1234261 RepID=A0A814WKC2_9BILA|nr:unnamed protein product [Didymodactylos carnosus]CAF3967080.1 unnamed protein product [Didymodactylos carnosus]